MQLLGVEEKFLLRACNTYSFNITSQCALIFAVCFIVSVCLENKLSTQAFSQSRDLKLPFQYITEAKT